MCNYLFIVQNATINKSHKSLFFQELWIFFEKDNWHYDSKKKLNKVSKESQKVTEIAKKMIGAMMHDDIK